MRHQPKFRPQSASNFFADGRADRMPPEHVVRADLPVRHGEGKFIVKDNAVQGTAHIIEHRSRAGKAAIRRHVGKQADFTADDFLDWR